MIRIKINHRYTGPRDRKNYMKRIEKYLLKKLEEIHCISEMYNQLILETTHAEQIMSWEKQEHTHPCQVRINEFFFQKRKNLILFSKQFKVLYLE